MRLRLVLGNLGNVLRLFSFTFLLPALVAMGYEADAAGTVLGGVAVPGNALVFASLFLLTLALGVFLEVLLGAEEFREGEGFALVGFGYLAVAALGALPYLLTGAIPGVLDAFFESMSGFTTVGATVMAYPLEQYAPSVLFWRSLTMWLGGMGIIVLGVALLPKLVASGGALMRAEFSGGQIRLRPKLAETARSLWGMYFLLTLAGTALLTLALWAAGLDGAGAFLEAVNHVFSALSTGGFSTRTASVAAFDSVWVELILVLLMVAGATSFVLHFRALHGEGLKAYTDEEFVFLGVLLVSVTAAVAVIVFFLGGPEAWGGETPSAGKAFRDALFTVASLMTTTGFTTANFDAWPDAARILLILVMVTGGMAGSTTGGLKTMRILVLLRLLRRETIRIVHPRAVVNVRIRGEVVDEQTLHSIAAFFFASITVLLGSTILLTFTGLDMVAAFTSSVATHYTVGPGMGAVVGGPDFTYAAVHPLGKVVLIGNMLFGRLEIFAVLLLLLPSTYRR